MNGKAPNLNPASTRKTVWIILAASLMILSAQFFYYSRVYSETNRQPQTGYDLVLMYTGEISLTSAADIALAGHAPLFISGGINPIKSVADAQKLLGNLPVVYNPHAQTTDQNARESSDFIRQKHFHQVLLVTGWGQLPRALLLTRYYLIGSGVKILSTADHPAPKNWWRSRQAWLQFFKLWGSLGRVVLHWVGVDHWPAPEWMP